ncbi:DUF4350 domain-containing protein [Vitiosangium sp. GDMCC 1.1324]|uniref:DUF4350 domain-containing protein n=1 Tax=Vitiosangium sp. (strain GDMCC 1.1324) TaxID=2138576 RepID=UPI000D39E623|nr:DUF4350 domain-containing protein [Vitiosangium sp. GDMCC 1.1324]PTL77287.1 DUF4350 domain-containing protein [Vitiosangium sp. GDMCC 1.1324]
MKGLRTAAIYGVLVALALALGLAVNQAPPLSTLPSVDNPGPMGLRALYLYLEESGAPVSALREALDVPGIPEGVRTVVVAAPTGRPVTEAEAEALRQWVSRGGTLVYLVSRNAKTRQPHLDDWLRISEGSITPPDSEGLPSGEKDLTGTTARVWAPVGAARGLERLRVSLDQGMTVGLPEALPLAGAKGAAVLWRVPEGRGEVYVLAGVDLAENRRLELLDNLRFWDSLAARGPIAFDEFHHSVGPKPEPPSARALWVFVAQGLVVGLLYAVSRGTRFGPPRPQVVEKHRSALEYVRSLGGLARRSKVERELVPELARQLRRHMHERLGIPLALPEDEAARLLEQTCGVKAADYLAAREELVRTMEQRDIRPSEYARLVRRYSQFENIITGRAAPRAENP